MSDLIFSPELLETNRVQNSLESEKASFPCKNDAQLKKACVELESLFINYLLKEMRATIPKSGSISGGKAEEIYTSMLDCQLAKEMAFSGGIGLSSLICDHVPKERGRIN